MQLTIEESLENAQARKLKEEQNLWIDENETYLDIWNFDVFNFPVIRYEVNGDYSYTLVWSDYSLDPKYDTLENINILPALLLDLKRAI